MSANFPGEQPKSVTIKSTSQCACSCTECVCVTRCVGSLNDTVHIQGTSDTAGEIRRDSTGKVCDNKEEAGHACAKLSECVHVSNERESSVYKNGEECVFVGENVESGACESDKGSVSTKERVLLVEKEGCATVVMYPERHTAQVFLADGTVVTGDNRGAYQVGGQQQI